MSTHEIILIADANSDKQTEARIIATQFTPQERLSRSLKVLGACWGLGIVSVFVPILHFVLVPSLLIAGPIAALKVHKRTSKIIGGRVICPNCKTEFEITKGPGSFPITEICVECRAKISLNPRA